MITLITVITLISVITLIAVITSRLRSIRLRLKEQLEYAEDKEEKLVEEQEALLMLRVMTNKEGLPKPRLMSDSGKSWTNQEANTVITMITGSPSE
ncbi:MAG: hypothetical protein FE78DRAFT_27252 [Acidomyces sp. 'richmondensis']|nr:MAG: hypothetical protein FE78DRAFT_27252 [Acidomyces sp. 'richmondensis']